MNSTFTVIRTIGKNSFKKTNIYSEDEIKKVIKPIKFYHKNDTIKPNIILFILESMGREYWGSLNQKNNIDNFISYMNQTVYGMNWTSPFYGNNPPYGSWCKLNVTNCNPPGYMTACPSHAQQGGYLSIFKLNAKTIKVCSNLGNSSGQTKYIENTISYE